MTQKIIKSVKDLLTQEFLSDLLSNASYGNSWFAFGTHKDTPEEVYQAAKSIYECREDIWAYNLLHGGYLLVEDVEEETDYKLSLKDIIKGMKIMILNYPRMYASLMYDGGDIYDNDAVIQCAVFGELTYG